MNVFRNPEYRGILVLVAVIAAMGFLLAVVTGRVELFPGPKALDQIIFVSDASGSAEIWAMNADGSNRVQLTKGARVRSAPALSPAGNRILYVGRFARSDQVFAIGALGGTPDRLTSATGPKKEPRYTPDDKQISFMASGKVYVAEKNGDNPRAVLPTAYEIRAAMSNPLRRGEVPAYLGYAWAPDSTAIAGIRHEPGGSDSVVFLAGHDAAPQVINTPELPWATLLNKLLEQEGASKRRIAPDEPVRVNGLSWAVDQPLFAASVVSRNYGFVLISGAEKGELRLGGFKSFEGQDVGQPAFAPDGSAVIVVARSKGGGSEGRMLKLDLADGSVHAIASGLFERPTYSPDGEKVLATLSDDAGLTRNLVVVELATGRVERLTRDGSSYDGVWSPASEK